MGNNQGERLGMELPRCGACKDVIGVYEPLMHLNGGSATRSSRAAEPEICSSGECYHFDCYVQLGNSD
jgi:hypothetical protein